MTRHHTPSPIDIHVGSRLRMRRMMLGMSQGKLAEAFGLTFQQVQNAKDPSSRASRIRKRARARFSPRPQR